MDQAVVYEVRDRHGHVLALRAYGASGRLAVLYGETLSDERSVVTVRYLKLALLPCVLAISTAAIGATAAAASPIKVEGGVTIESEKERTPEGKQKDHIHIKIELKFGKGNLIARMKTPGNVFEGVTRGGVPCNSEGAKEGEVITAPTTLEVGTINAKKKEVGLEERPTEGDVYARFMCGAESVEWRGAFIGRLSPVDKTVAEGAAVANTVALREGKDEITQFEGSDTRAVMEESVDGGPFEEVGFADSSTIKFEGGSFKVKPATKKQPAALDFKPEKKK